MCMFNTSFFEVYSEKYITEARYFNFMRLLICSGGVRNDGKFAYYIMWNFFLI